MLKHFEIQMRRSLPVAAKGLDRLLLLLLLTLGLAGCYTTFRPPESLEQPTPPVVYDTTRVDQPAPLLIPAPAPYGYYPQNQFGWNSQYNWGYPSWGSFYPYSYYQNSPWGSYYYQPWWGNNYYNSPYYPYYPSPGPGSPGEPQEKRSFAPRGNSTNPPPPPPPQNQGYSPPPPQNQGQGQQNPPNNDDNKKRDTDKRGRRS